MAYEWIIWKKLCVTCYVLYEDVMCCVTYDDYNDACYSHVMTFLTQYGKFTNFPNLNLASLLTWLPKIMSLVKRCSFSCMSLVCACIYLYLVQVCTNPITLYNFSCRQRWTLEIHVDAETIQMWGIHTDFVWPHDFKDACLLYSSLVIGLS